MFRFDNKYRKLGYKFIAGIDEAGRGPLAGPVVAAAVILPANLKIPGINDSKLLTAKQRNLLFNIIIKKSLSVTTSVLDSKIIDSINIFNATYTAMKHCVAKLTLKPDIILIDGPYKIPGLNKYLQKPVIKGDKLSASIACASIIAKVTRDRIMEELHRHYPQYDFITHKGYPTKRHKSLIKQHGLSPVHRLTFKYE